MTDPDKSEASADEAGSERETAAQDQTRSTGAEDTGAAADGSSSETESESSGATGSATAESSGGSGSESTRKLSAAETGSDEQQTEEVSSGSEQTSEQPAASAEQSAGATAQEDGEKPAKKGKTKVLGALLGVTSTLLVAVVAIALVALFVYPGYAGPGDPDKTAQSTATALASKDPAQLEQVSCKSPEGKPTTQIPPQAMQMIAAAQSTAPPQVVLDTEAHAPMNLTLSAQGQTQTLPSIAVLGVSHHEWCLKGLAQQQQGGGGQQ